MSSTVYTEPGSTAASGAMPVVSLAGSSLQACFSGDARIEFLRYLRSPVNTNKKRFSREKCNYYLKDGLIYRNAKPNKIGNLPTQVVLDSNIFDM